MKSATPMRGERSKDLPWPWTRHRGNHPKRGRLRRMAMVRGPPVTRWMPG